MRGLANHFYIMHKLVNWSQLSVCKVMKNTRVLILPNILRAAFQNAAFVLVREIFYFSFKYLAFKKQLQVFLTSSARELH